MTLVWSILVAVALTAFIVWFFFAPRKAHKAQVSQGMQTAHVVVRGGYEPSLIEVKAGTPIVLDFDRKESGECSSHVVFPGARHRPHPAGVRPYGGEAARPRTRGIPVRLWHEHAPWDAAGDR